MWYDTWALAPPFVFLNLAYGNVERCRQWSLGEIPISLLKCPEGWLNDSCKSPSSCRGRKSWNPCGGGSGLQMPMWLWQSAYFLYQETDTWIGEISKLRRHLSDFHDMREVQISLQMVGPNIRNASRTCLHHIRKQNNWRGFCLNNLRIESIPLDFDSLHHPVELGCKAANSML